MLVVLVNILFPLKPFKGLSVYYKRKIQEYIRNILEEKKYINKLLLFGTLVYSFLLVDQSGIDMCLTICA